MSDDTTLAVSAVSAHGNGQFAPGPSLLSTVADEPLAALAAPATVPEQTRQVLERITDGFCALDREWRVTYLNAAAERALACNRDEVLGQTFWEAFPPAVETPLCAAFNQAMDEGNDTNVNVFYPPRDAWLNVRTYPSRDGLSVYLRDVTESRRLTEDLWASEARFRMLVEQIPAVIYTQANDERQTSTYFSPQFAALTGFPMDEIMDQPPDEHWHQFLHPDDYDRVAAADAQSVATGEPFRSEYRLRRRDGSYVWVQDECAAVRDESGQIVAWQGVLLDITGRMQAEEAQARLAAIVESADDAIISSAFDGTITSWNGGAERLYGYPAAEMLGKPITLLLPAHLDDPLLKERIAAVLSGASVEPFETVRQRRDGSQVNVAIALSPIRDRFGTVTGLSSITRDITARKQAAAALAAALAAAEEANQAKSHFLAMMSHELRTPLQAVLGYAEYLLADAGASFRDEQRVDLGYIQQGGRRMLTLVNQLLDLSRIEAGRLDLDRKRVNLAAVVEQVRQDIAPLATQKALALRIELPETLPPVVGDAERLRQVLLNLAGNAVKFTERGSVLVAADATVDGVAVAVRDTGIGIAPEDLPHVFEKFQQVDSSLARRHGGAGLGLAIAQKLTELMDGRITVESTPGAGTTFTLFLPTEPTPRA